MFSFKCVLLQEDKEEQTSGLQLEDEEGGGDEDLEGEEEPRQQPQPRKAAWVDEDDELEEE